MHRIALLGNIGSGKSSIAKAWLASHRVDAEDHRPLYLSFAGALKAELARMLSHVDDGDVLDYVQAQLDPERKDEFRSLQQALGQYRRSQDPDYWLKKVMLIVDGATRADVRARETTFVAIDDCRFPNEEKALRERGFVFIRLADGSTTRKMTEAQAADESEQHWRKFHADIVLPYRKGPEAQAARINKLLEGTYEEGLLS